MSDAIVTFNRSMRIELLNRAAEALLQCARAEVVGGSFERFLTTGLHQALEASLAEFDRSVDARPRMWSPGGLLALSADGHEFPIDVAISCAEASEGDLYTLILRTVDKTAQKIPDLAHQDKYLEEQISAAHNFEEIVGQSPALHTLLKQVNLVGPTDSTVLLLGETGTGKELVARAIHSHSLRKNRPLIGVNCAALPTGLIDSRLFGHEKGAFYRSHNTPDWPL
jgi:transcriptional regulator with PAS, ATPase and Fis domain